MSEDLLDTVYMEGFEAAREDGETEKTECPYYDKELRETWALGYYDWVTNEKEKRNGRVQMGMCA